MYMRMSAKELSGLRCPLHNCGFLLIRGTGLAECINSFYGRVRCCPYYAVWNPENGGWRVVNLHRPHPFGAANGRHLLSNDSPTS